ncbi:class I SAM-dependent methyltransferase [Krasilnikovia sp. MM14-A1259]|uniref:class I SAM-dependent methyltransferase n=1 Tax=Krasilnikovia sp. MM14-A1259 TaxID=3373539 RepID=UPI0038255F58
MPAELHRDVGRAGSFGSVAEQYDRFRNAYPPALIDDLLTASPARALDVGCGTGKVAAALAAHGVRVLGVERDHRMAAVARGHDLDVEVADFETWDDAGRTFDLLTCGDAWHWIDPERGAAKAAAVLAPGATIARFWTELVLGEPLVAAFEPVYRRHAPEVAPVWRAGSGVPRFHATRPDAVAASAAFSAPTLRTYAWERTYAADEWVGLVATISDHLRLGATRLPVLLDALHDAIRAVGGTVAAQHETYAMLSRRV